jgi:hypothetical protein
MYGEIISKLQDFHNQRDFTKITKEREVILIQIQNWVTGNIVDIFNTLGINEYYKDVIDDEIDNFISYDIGSVEPPYNELEDDDYIEDFQEDLTNYLENKFDLPFDLNNFIERTDIINDLIYVIGEIPNVSHHISDGSIMDMLEPGFYLRDGYGDILNDISEIIYENMVQYCIGLIENETRDFVNKY